MSIPGLTNGQTYQVEVRACNGEAAFAEDVRCGPPGGPVPGRPFGGLTAPTVQIGLVTPLGQKVTANWTFPDRQWPGCQQADRQALR